MQNHAEQPTVRKDFQHAMGFVTLTANKHGLVSVDWDQVMSHDEDTIGDGKTPTPSDTGDVDADAEDIAYGAMRQIQEYLDGRRKTFDVPLVLRGTPFQQSVWKALLSIPYGDTQSYRDIAVAIGNPNAVRAVGQANRANHIPIIIPCHRVIGANGSLTGYAGSKVQLKAALLNHERAHLDSGRQPVEVLSRSPGPPGLDVT